MIILSLIFNLAFADSKTFQIKGMDCGGCVKIIDSAVCKDKEMKTWFTACSSKILNAKNQIGELRLETLPVVQLDEKKLKQIEQAIEKTGRSIQK